MCLYSRKREPQIAEEDIVCYKILRWDVGSNEVATPFCGIVIPTIPYLMDDSQTTEDIIRSSCTHMYRIRQGYIHSLSNIHLMSFCPIHNTFYVKCIIPKGTPYFVGEYDDLCSKKLQIVDFVPTEEVSYMAEDNWIYDYEVVEKELCTTEKLQELFPDAPSAKVNKTSCVEVELKKEEETICV